MAKRPFTLLPSLIGAAVLCLCASWAHAQTSAPAPVAVEGQPIAEVRVVDDSGKVLEDNPKDLPLQAGQPFNLDRERDSLRQLFRTGRYADLVAQTTPVPGGLRLDFVARANFYVSVVRIEGLREPPSDAVAVSAMRLPLGEVFRESAMPAALARLKQTLDNEGLYQAKTTYRLSPHPSTRQMDIVVSVEQGPRARLGTVTVVNQTPFPEGGLLQRLKLKPNREVTSEALDHSADIARKWMVKRGYLGARVSIVRGRYDPKLNQVPIEAQVAAGLNMHVDVTGAKISKGKIRQLLPVYAEGAVDEDLLEEGRRNLRDYLERLGYFDAKVDYTTSQPQATAAGSESQPVQAPTQGTENITYQIARGARRRLAKVAMEGNHYFSDEIVRTRIRIQPASLGSAGRFSSGQLTDDVAAISDLYRANGFRQVQVTRDLVENYRGKMGDYFVTFHIVEGPQTRIAGLTLKGNKQLSDAELSRVIGSTPGQPFSDFNVAGDRDNLLALYYNQGFPDARFQAEVTEVPTVSEAAGDAGGDTGGDTVGNAGGNAAGSTAGKPAGSAATAGPRVNLVYEIEEGAQVRVAQVLFSGEDRTHPYVIERENQIKIGQPLSESAVVETQRRLYGLGIFNRVTIAPQNPTGTDPDKTVDVLVEEAKRYTIAYGLGFEAQRLGSAVTGPVAEPLNFSPRVTFEASKINLTGRADTLSFKIRASTLQGRALLSYSEPYLFGKRNWSLLLTGLFDKTRDVLTFTSTRSEGSVQLTDQISPITSVLFRYVYRHVVASDLQVAPEAIPLFSQPTEVSFISVSWLRDHRDSPSDPTRGSVNSVDLDYATRSLGSSASFLRGTLQNSTYTHITRKLVFARSTRLGVEQPLGATTSDIIPLPERFFAGGGTTLRGFGLNQAGPRDPLTGFPIGGLGMLIFNQQLQFPMHLPFFGDSVGGAVFYDAGNVFSDINHFTFATRPPGPVFNPSEPNVCVTNCGNQLNYFSHTVGFELRYHTPVGPVSIDLAYQLNAAHFLIPTGSTTGICATTTCVSVSRLPAFQFFVNLGSTF